MGTDSIDQPINTISQRRVLAGRWIVRDDNGRVVGVGTSAAEAATRGGIDVPDCTAWVSPHPPHVILPAWPVSLLRELAGDRPLWLAGGPVRDLLLDRQPNDWDFVLDPAITDHTGLHLARTVANRLDGAYYPLDAERGTGRAILQDPCSDREVTVDVAELRASELEGDLRARDFTINAMAMTLDGKIIDPTGGLDDLLARRLKVTHPGAFTADPVRMLRAVRLTYQFSLTMETGTRRLIAEHASDIANTATERVHAELLKLMSLDRAAEALDDLAALGLLRHVLPAVAILRTQQATYPRSYPNVWQHTLATIAAVQYLEQRLTHQNAPKVGGHAFILDDSLSKQCENAPKAIPVPNWATQGCIATALNTYLGDLRSELTTYLTTEIAAGVTYSDLLPWAALFHEIVAASTVDVDEAHRALGLELVTLEEQLTALRFSNKAVSAVIDIIQGLYRFQRLKVGGLDGPSARPEHIRPSRRDVYCYYRDVGPVGAGAVLVALARLLADWRGAPPHDLWAAALVTAQVMLVSFLHFRDEIIDPPPMLTGSDLITLGIAPGPAMGGLLKALKEAQAAGEITTPETAQAFVLAHAEALDADTVGIHGVQAEPDERTLQ